MKLLDETRSLAGTNFMRQSEFQTSSGSFNWRILVASPTYLSKILSEYTQHTQVYTQHSPQFIRKHDDL